MTSKPRLATVADVDGVRSVVEAAYSHYVPRLGRRPAPMDADYQAAVAAGRTWVLGDAEVWAVLVLVPAADHLLIENVAVLPACQGQGLGRRLLAFAEQRARTAGLPEVRLYTNQRMTENLAWYRRLGYEETSREIQDGYARVFLRKRLDRPSAPSPP